MAGDLFSDHLAILTAYNEWLDARNQGGYRGTRQFCMENFLSSRTLTQMTSTKRQFVELLSDVGFVRTGLRSRDIERYAKSYGGDGIHHAIPEFNSRGDDLELVKALLVAALYPNGKISLSLSFFFN